jgi:hypothetical protein
MRDQALDCALRITARDGGGEVELGDGGFTDWTAQLTGDAKERCLISCLATERLTALAEPDVRSGPAEAVAARRQRRRGPDGGTVS